MNDRIKYNDDNTLDEVVFENADFHLEQMSDGIWWIGVTNKTNGKLYHINLFTQNMNQRVLARMEEQ